MKSGHALRLQPVFTGPNGNLQKRPPRRALALSVCAEYNVVVTGSTKGVGKALAEGFVRAGDNVVVCSRDKDRVQATVEELQALAGQLGTGVKVRGLPTNVARAADVTALANFASEELGSVDLWVNNAGTNAYKFKSIMEQSEEDIVSIVETNVLGVMLCCREGIRVMRQQPRGGHIFFMDGAGADGGATPRFAAYGATKRSLEQLSKSLRAELKMAGISNVGIHNLSPGMVTTDLLMAGADNKLSKFFINCLAETPESVADFLVPRIRAVPKAYQSSPLAGLIGGQYIRFLTKPKAYGQLIRRLVAGERKNRFVPEE